LLIADHFAPKNTNEFKFLFNNNFGSFAMKAINNKPAELGYFGDTKYAANTLKVRRLKGNAVIEGGEEMILPMTTMVASIEID
ncbi:hypothetical protein, partial [Fulvivirga aurantia]|uniref:hypothetical protein n=1 Tax=Fulvivirga aurantia TaxID=2529383 RepID=UPI00162A7005